MVQPLDELALLYRFCRQVLQVEQHLDFPPPEVLRQDHAQDFIFEQAFSQENVARLPPASYRLKTLQKLISRIEDSITDWDLHGVSDRLASALADLLSSPIPSNSFDADRRDYVTYTLSALSREPKPTITLLEKRALLSAAGTTGRRTWEAALHLGHYLCVNQHLVAGKRVLELGAGTGYLSVLCARHLGAAEVVATDGSSDVVSALADNFFINSLQESGRIRADTLKWGHILVDNDDLNGSSGTAVDVVLGADITFDESIIMPLLGTIQEVFEMASQAGCLIAATERNRKTFDFFLKACTNIGLDVEIIDFPITRRGEQMGPFHSDSVPIHICKLKTRPN